MAKDPKKVKAGKAGYAAVTARIGKDVFHKAGGDEFARKIDAWTCPCHGVGLAAYTSHGNKLIGKKHRYGTEDSTSEIIKF